MSETNGLKGKFKSKGASILKASPKSMKEFLNDGSNDEILENNTHIHKNTIAQNHNSIEQQNEVGHYEESCNNSNEIARIHVHIRKELADKMFDLVFRRKRNRQYSKGTATQKAIIEEALEDFFTKHKI